MASPSFLRFSGLALLIGSLIFAISTAISAVIPGPLGLSGPPPVWDAWIGAIGGLVLLVGLPALYTVQSKHAGIIGLLGMISLFVAFLLLAVVSNIIPAIAFAANAVPSSMEQPQPPLFVLIIFLIGGVLLVAGSILFGIATLRTRAFENWAIWALMVLSVLSIVILALPLPTPIFGSIATVLLLLLFIWFGYKLAFQTNTGVEVIAASADAPDLSASS